MEKTRCSKCSYESDKNREKFGLPLCSICYLFAPNDPVLLDEYVSEKVHPKCTDSFRRFYNGQGGKQKKGMSKKASGGFPVTRPPFGYSFKDKKLVPDENARIVEEIFLDFLNNKISLNRLAKKYNFSVNGIKKILSNFTYVGKIKFNGEIYNGAHEPIVSSTLFNHVQDKLESIKRNKTN